MRGNCCESYVLSSIEKRNGYAGGIFFELAQAVIRAQGVVVGAAYMKDFCVRHIEVDNIAQVDRIVGVKYAESQIDSKLKAKIKSRLQLGQTVLFAGTPCQIAHMYKYLGNEYKDFLTIAITCTGVIRSKVWQDYISEVQSNGSVITEVYCPYRGEFGISQTKFLIKFRHGTAYFRDEKDEKLLMLKNAGFIFREECYQCLWNRENLQADLLLETYYVANSKDVAQEKGLTQATVYTEKGKRLLEIARCGLRLEKRTPIDKGTSDFRVLKPEQYDYFWKYYDAYGFSFATEFILSQQDKMLNNETLRKFLEQYAILDAKNVSLEKVLDNWGVNKVILYSSDTISKMIADKLKDSDRIYAIIEPNFDDDNRISILKSGFPILISPLCFVLDVLTQLKAMGIDRKRVLPLKFLINWEYDRQILKGCYHAMWDEKGHEGVRDVYLITGAQFGNKGAQSMLFVAISELRRKHPNCDIYFLPIDSDDHYPDSILSKYQFHIIRGMQHIYSQLYDLLPQVKAIIDVSGYALSSKWNRRHFMRSLLLSSNNHIPIYFMPQSFGPLDFAVDWQKRIKLGLTNAKVVFARERAGYDLLTEKYGLKNCRLSEDLVLQNREIIRDSIYLDDVGVNVPGLRTHDNVAIVPNIRNYEFGNRTELKQMYKDIVIELLSMGKTIYIVPHSKDEEACNDIYEMFSENKRVILYRNQLDCLEFSSLIENFQYIIASRYHAIIHAYKKGIPCVAIGWAEKYREVLYLFNQNEYAFDVRKKIDISRLIQAIRKMNASWIQEKEKIQAYLPAIQANNCFDVIE